MIKDILAVILLVAQLVKDLPHHKEHMMWIKRIALAKKRMDKQQRIARKHLRKLIIADNSSKNRYYADLLKGDHVISIMSYPMDVKKEDNQAGRHPLLDATNGLLHDVIIEVVRHNLMALVDQFSYNVSAIDGSIIRRVDEVVMKRLIYVLSQERQLSRFFDYSKDFIQSVITWRCLRAYFSHWVTSLNSIDQGCEQPLIEEMGGDPAGITTYRYRIADLGSQNPFMNTKTVYVTIEYPGIRNIIHSGKPQWRYVLNWYRDYKRFKITFG